MNPMNRRVAILIASLICMMTTACTTIKPVYEGLQASFASQRKGAVVEEEWADIFSVETVKISPIKTAGAAVGIVAAIPFLALGAMFMGAGY